MSRKYNVAVVGATGNVGRHILDILDETKFPVGEIHALASSRSAGKKVNFGECQITVKNLVDFDFCGIDIAFFSAGSSVSAEYAPIAAEHAVVIDNTSYFRMEPDIPLVIPEVNGFEIAQYKNRNIVANPNCAAIQLLLVLKPLHDVANVRRVVITTMQSVSGAGKKAMDELYAQTKDSFLGNKVPHNALPGRIAFNLLPQIGDFGEDGVSAEERKIDSEVKKILDTNIRVSATCVRVPVFVGHSEAVNIEFTHPLSAHQAYEVLENAPGIMMIGGLEEPQRYVVPIDCPGDDAVYVSRLRNDDSLPNSLNMWIVSDNLRKGAALNAVQIAQELVLHYM
jgi:aspartate-semialdehyde dehydrogenase